MNVEIRRCIHVKPDGTQCGSPALRGKPRCYYHIRPARPKRDPALDLPDLTGPRGMIGAVNELFRAVMHDKIHPKRASLMLYAIQIAQKEKHGRPGSN